MNKWIGLGVLSLLAACDVPQAPVVTGPDGQARIQINTSGLTCYDNQCLYIDPFARSVRQIGNRAARIPGNINVSAGSVSPVEIIFMLLSFGFAESGSAAI